MSIDSTAIKNAPAILSTSIQKLDIPKDYHIQFQPRPISLEIIPPFIKPSIETPLTNIAIIENPLSNDNAKEITEKANILQDFDCPTNQNHGEDGIQAAVLIGIRKRKMKKHKLRKLRKKMKFEWAKVRQRRELRKEKAFQAGLIAQIKEAEKFSAEQYVSEKIRQANETPVPRFWKGRQLPAFIVKQKMDELEAKKRKQWLDSVFAHANKE